MSSPTQLLCTFCTSSTLDETLKKISKTYTISFNSIYILENVDEKDSFCCTYNVELYDSVAGDVPSATISLHRKKATNTLYTINALNLLVAELNNGQADKHFELPWNDYKNTILVTAYGKLKKINTKLLKIVKIDD